MNKSMLLSILALTSIILVASFNIQLSSIAPIYSFSEATSSEVLYVCSASNGVIDQISVAIKPLIKHLNIVFFFAIILILCTWAWALYQNLLKDSFDQKSYKNPWGYTKLLFWVSIIILLIGFTPNHYRSVKVYGSAENWVLCEENSPGAKAVKSDSVHR